MDKGKVTKMNPELKLDFWMVLYTRGCCASQC